MKGTLSVTKYDDTEQNVADAEEARQALAARLMLEVVKCAPVAIWACDSDFNVALWNRGAEQIYRRSEGEMIGSPYYDKFVDALELEQSKADTLRIIEYDTPHRNFIATDHVGGVDPPHEDVLMLTNCFRVVDPITKRRYQAEIGVDITNLEEKMAEYHLLRERWTKEQAQTELMLEMEKKEAGFVISRLRTELISKRERIVEGIEQYRFTARRQQRRAAAEAIDHADALERNLVSEFDVIDKELQLLAAEASAATNAAIATRIRESVSDPSKWLRRLQESQRDSR
jgi:PAS domain-containing protein